jgi:hypothetical protein
VSSSSYGSYLVDPETFPRGREGEPWGDATFALRLAGRDIRIQGLSERQYETLVDLWSGFDANAPSAREATSVSLFRVPAARFRRFDPRGWSYALEFDYGPTHTHITGIDLMGRIDWEERLAGSLWATSEEPECFHGVMENFLRVLLAHAVLLDGGVLLHSAAVVEASGARVFVGHSGAGKSTIASLALASGRKVLSDDLNVVLPGSEGFLLAGSPFHGDVGDRRDGSYPLRGLFRLAKGRLDAVRPMGAGEAVASLVAASPFVNHSPHLAEVLWSNVSSLARSVPTGVLTFRREGTFWNLLDA